MKFTLLKQDSKQGLTVKSVVANDYDVSYNFGDSELVYKPTGQTRLLSSYIMSNALINAINAALVTGRPLLVKGEPGSGKTKLALATAMKFFGKDLYKYYFEWHVKSRSKAREGGYTFDHVGRLRDATISSKDKAAEERAADPSAYVTLGAMGCAFKTVVPKGSRPILLIDEIDKGDIDFPNDLLLELDEMRFAIPEMPRTYIEAERTLRPLVFITSNDERELPPAFLRRCLYYYIPPFDTDLLEKIARSKLTEHYKELGIRRTKKVSDTELSDFVQRFQQLKDNASGKPPSTSEMLDWLKLLTWHQHNSDASFAALVADERLQEIALKLNA